MDCDLNDILIEDMGIKGDGIGALPDGARVFVPGALPGERVRIGSLMPRDEGFSAKLLGITLASPERVAPPCPFFGRCGGCALQHMSGEAYSRFKRGRVMQALSRFDLNPDSIEGPFLSQAGSRRRAVLSAKCTGSGEVHLGFNERASHVLAEIESCAVLSPVLEGKLLILRKFLPEIMQEGESYDIALAESAGLVDLLVTVLGKKERDCGEAIKRSLKDMATLGNFSRIAWQTSRAHQPEVIIERGEAYHMRFGAFRVFPPPGAFFQATAAGDAALIDFVLSSLKKKSRVVDLYAGCGTFALSLLSQGHRVDAFEGEGAALSALAAAGAGQSGLHAEKRDLAKEPLTFQELKIYDAVVIDPPRLGAFGQMEEIARSEINRVISVSCNPDSFARDARVLVQKGFRIKKLAIIDQFLWSHHVEIAALLIRAK